MEKQGLPDTAPACGNEQQQKKASSKHRRFIAVVFLIYAVWLLCPSRGTWFPLRVGAPTSSKDSCTENSAFKWSNVPSKPYLDYVNCFGGFQCARLELPMDYWNGTTNATVSVAVIKQPADVPVTHPKYGGVTIHNPGGPGGSGVGFLLAAAPLLRQFIDSDDETDENGKYFDHLSFDPRGIGATLPKVRCFNDFMNDLFWAVRTQEQGVFSASDAAFGRLWSMDAARWQSCSLPVEEGEIDIKQYVSTASVARDMLEIVEAHGEWREKEARRILESEPHCDAWQSKDGRPPHDILESLKHRHGEEKINYWGFSYGSYLGNTFAAMFPDRINRLIVDGVVDAYDYKKALWLDNLVDTERGLQLFSFHCARAGYPACALADEHGTNTEESVKQRMDNITNSLYHNPLPIISKSVPGVITYSLVRLITFSVLYTPIGGFEFLANFLAGIENGDIVTIGEMVQDFRAMQGPSHSTFNTAIGGDDDDDDDDAFDIMGDAQTAIACGDGDSQNHLTKEDFAGHVKNITKISPISEMWATIRMKCIHWNTRPYSRFEGPWIGNTSHPILEIGNDADPVTPGRYAVKMAKGFTNGVALIQNSGGHCSISAPSKCTENYVRRYFQTGELPAPNTVCEVDAYPFGPGPDESAVLDEEAVRRRERQLGIARALYASGGGYLNSGLSASWLG